MLDFPTARPLVMDPKRTFLEKAAAIHVSCRRGRWGSSEGDRYSRHWYDLDRLARAGIAEAAVRDRTLAAEVAQHKEDFWRAMDADEQPIDYLHALSGNLQLVPIDAARQALESDYTAMASATSPWGGAVACLSFALDFALFGPAGLASDTLTDKKDPLHSKESDGMEPSGFEPLTPCMPCRESRLCCCLFSRAKAQCCKGF